MKELRFVPAALAAATISLCLHVLPAAAADEPAAPPQETSTGSTEEKAQKVCKKIEMPGSRVSRHKICKTRAEWAEIEAASQKAPGTKD